MKKKISIVVPIYNLEHYLDKCINSILMQTYGNIEVILVDDGSQDGSACICDKYAEQDDRVIVIHKDNGGVVSARQAGIEVSTGEYIGFVDGDDWIEPCMYEKLVEYIDCSDLVTSGYYKDFGKSSTIIVDAIPAGEYKESRAMEYILKNMILYDGNVQMGLMGVICNKIFKTKIVKEFFLSLDTSLKFGEDMVFLHTYLMHCSSLVVTHNVYYHYYMRKQSAVHVTDECFLIKINQLYLALKRLYAASDLQDILLHNLEKYTASLVCRGVNSRMGFHKEIRIPRFGFPFAGMKKEEKIILYGAGDVGQDYYAQICKKGQSLVLWADKNWEQYHQLGLDVVGISKIPSVEYEAGDC